MKKERETARIRVLLGGILCQFCAGMLYSWSLYVNPLTQTHGWARSQVTLTFSIATFLVPIVMIYAGRLLPKLGPTKTALIGAGLLTAGLITGCFATTLPLLYLGYGVLGGAGVGFIYGVPIATCVKWYPDKKGMISGLTVAGFGLGSIVFAPVCTALITTFGPNRAFLGQAAITLVGMLIGAPMMKTAPDGYAPRGWMPATSGAAGTGGSYTSGEMLRTSQYWFLLVMYLFANVAGLFVVGHASPIGQELAGITPAQAGLIVSVLSVANTCGRFLGGTASDRFGAKRVVTVIYAANVILFLGLRFMTSFGLLACGIGALAVCFGGMMGVYPSLVLDYFGPKHYSTNYAFVFLAYGIGGLLANFVAAGATLAGGYTLAFLVIGGACVLGCIMSLAARRPAEKPAEIPT